MINWHKDRHKNLHISVLANCTACIHFVIGNLSAKTLASHGMELNYNYNNLLTEYTIEGVMI